MQRDSRLAPRFSEAEVSMISGVGVCFTRHLVVVRDRCSVHLVVVRDRCGALGKCSCSAATGRRVLHVLIKLVVFKISKAFTVLLVPWVFYQPVAISDLKI